MVPATYLVLGAVAVTPAVKVMVSPEPLPKVTVPVFRNVVAVPIVVVEPLKAMLYALSKVPRPYAEILPETVIVPV